MHFFAIAENGPTRLLSLNKIKLVQKSKYFLYNNFLHFISIKNI